MQASPINGRFCSQRCVVQTLFHVLRNPSYGESARHYAISYIKLYARADFNMEFNCDYELL